MIYSNRLLVTPFLTSSVSKERVILNFYILDSLLAIAKETLKSVHLPLYHIIDNLWNIFRKISSYNDPLTFLMISLEISSEVKLG